MLRAILKSRTGYILVALHHLAFLCFLLLVPPATANDFAAARSWTEHEQGYMHAPFPIAGRFFPFNLFTVLLDYPALLPTALVAYALIPLHIQFSPLGSWIIALVFLLFATAQWQSIGFVIHVMASSWGTSRRAA